MSISKKRLKRFLRAKKVDSNFLNEFHRLLKMYGKLFKVGRTDYELALFLGQIKAEIRISSNGRVSTRENMNYSVKGLKANSLFFRKNPKLATKYGYNKYHKANKVAIANLMYADKNRGKKYRLGNTKKGDGWYFRGVGVLQVTGRENVMLAIRLVEKALDIKLVNKKGLPYKGILDTYTMGILLSFAYWKINKLYLKKTADSTTKVINRGTDTYAKRRKYTKEAIAYIA